MHTRKRGRSRGQRRDLAVDGELRLPSAILAWEIDLLKPALSANDKAKRDRPPVDGFREVRHADQT